MFKHITSSMVNVGPSVYAEESVASGVVPDSIALDGVVATEVVSITTSAAIAEDANDETEDAPPTFGLTVTPIIPLDRTVAFPIIESCNTHGDKVYEVYVGPVYGSASLSFCASVDNSLVQLIELLNKADQRTRFVFYIASGGGSVDTAAAVCAAMASSSAVIETRAIGLCGSAAALIWTYGQIRTMSDRASLMFHMSSHTDGGPSTTVRQIAQTLIDYIVRVALTPVVDAGILTEEEFNAITVSNREIYLPAKLVRERMKSHAE